MTYRVSNAKEVVDPYDWLPGHGESSLIFTSEASNLTIEITYDREIDGGGSSIAKRELRFFGVCSFYKSAFPGAAGLIDVVYDTKWTIGSLIEFGHSEVADAWSAHFFTRLGLKHYLMQFTSENVQIHVVAESYVLGDEALA